jgi:hypothetical protein
MLKKISPKLLSTSIIFLGIVLCLTVNVLAEEPNLFASISNPKEVLYKNITSEKLQFTNGVEVKNNNDFEVQINVTPSDELKGYVQIIDKSFILKPGDEKDVLYQSTFTEEGLYGGDILVTFTRNDWVNQKLTIAQRFVVHVEDQRKSSSLRYVLIVAMILLILTLAILFTYRKKITKRQERKNEK